MMRKKRFFAAALAGLFLILAGCGPDRAVDSPPVEESDPPPVSEVPTYEQKDLAPFALMWDRTDTLDPIQAANPNRMLMPLVFQGLFAVNGAFEAEYVLCQSCTQSEDGRSWTFVLREDAAFSDGTPLTAVQTVRCLNAARDSSLYGSRLSAVSAVTAGEGSVTVTLREPNGNLPVLLDVPIFLEAEEGAYPLGTGPYCFDGGGEEELCLRLSPTWRGETMPLETIVLRPVSSVDERIAAFDTGEVTLVDTDFTGSGALGYSGRYENWDYPTSAMLYMGFNTRKGDCREETLRRAISWSIDRTYAASSLLAGHADPALLPVSPWAGLYDEELADELTHTVSDAEQLLADGGYRLNGDGLLTRSGRAVALTLLVNRENTFRTGLANHIAGELEKLGLTVTVRKLAWDDYLAALERGEFDLYLGQVKLTADFDLTELLEGELNYGGFGGRELAGLMAQMRALSGEAQKTAAETLYRELEIWTPFAPLCFIRGSVLTQWGSVSGLTPTQNDPFYGMETWKLT